MTKTNYIWDVVSDNLLMEVDDNGDTIASYEHEPGVHGELISQRRNGHTYYYHYDGMGNTVAVTDENQNVVETAAYSGFGEVVQKTTSIVNPFGYKGALGYYANPVTNELDVRARIYNPAISRWLSTDPVGFAVAIVDAVNLYGYARNNPLVYADRSGETIEYLSCGNLGCGIFGLIPIVEPELDLGGDGDEDLPKCKCGEKLVFVGNVELYKARLDVELPENIDTKVSATKQKKFSRKSPLQKTGTNTVRVLLSYDVHKVACCKDGKMRLLYNNVVSTDNITIQDANVPKPPGPPDETNMEKIAKCRFPVPFIWYGEGSDKAKCLALAFPGMEFGPRPITTKTDLDKCGANKTGTKDSK